MSYEREAELARQLALEAGSLALEYQRKGVTAEEKLDESPVTAADRACEKLIVEGIDRLFPEDGLLGEEGASRSGTSGRRWIIDPIDGTKDFIRGVPLWSVLIGLEDRGEIVAGAACCPGQNLTLSAHKGAGTWADGKRMHVQDLSDATKSILCFNGFHKSSVQRFGPELLPWVAQFWAVRSLGGAMDAMLMATGRSDIWIEPSASPWDLAALKILVEEAGAVYGAFDGSKSIYTGNAWAAVPGLEPVVQQLLSYRNRS